MAALTGTVSHPSAKSRAAESVLPPTRAGPTSISALVVAASECAPEASALLEFLAPQFPKWSLPDEIRCVAALPNGKPCKTYADCASGICDSATGTCGAERSQYHKAVLFRALTMLEPFTCSLQARFLLARHSRPQK